VCRSHALEPTFTANAWTSPQRTPPLYPDAVTLRRDCVGVDLLRLIDTTPGCGVKDSFGDLDLSTHGFGLLFEATWIAVDGATLQHEPTVEWNLITTTEGLEDWSNAWATDGSGRKLFCPNLLDEPRLSVVAMHRDGSAEAGAILFREAGVVGITNFFSHGSRDAFRGCLAIAHALEPALPLVAYERGPSLASALAVGFEAIGPLRVWTNET
jgi:hypothetical protein